MKTEEKTNNPSFRDKHITYNVLVTKARIIFFYSVFIKYTSLPYYDNFLSFQNAN